MIGALASATLIVAGSLVVGQAILALSGRPDPSWLSGPLGLALLLITAAIVVGVDRSAPAVAITVGLIVAAATVALLLRWRKGRGRAVTTPVPALIAAALAATFAAIPFIAAGNVGILGVGLVNDDMASHLLLTDWIREGFRPEPVLVDQGYPLGPHALVAGLGDLLGSSSVDVFAGLTLAIPALTALVAYSVLDGLRTAPRVSASALVALPYLAAAYLAQEAFKEPIVALFLLAFTLLVPTVRGWRDAVSLGILAAGTVYVYSFPGLAWLGGVAVAWALIELVRARRWAPFAAAAGNPGPTSSRRAVLGAVGAGVVVLAALALPELDRLRDFVDFRALHPDRANEGGLGNLPGQIPPLEALGIWPTSDFRRSAAASSVPVVVFYAGALFALFAFAVALPRWLRRHGLAVPAALATAVLLYLAALAFGTVYTSAKALAIAAPLITLIILGGLLAAGEPERERRGAPAPLAALAAAFATAAAFSSFLILRQAPVGPEAHANELAEIRPLVEGEKLLFLGRDNFILHELRGSKPFTHVRNFYDPYFVEPNFELERAGSKFDFDAVAASTLARFPYVLTTRASYASGPPPGYEPVAETESYLLWERGGRGEARRPGETDEEPGRVGGCSGRAERVASFAAEPVVAAPTDWSAATIEGGEEAVLEVELTPGAWDLSLEYDSTRPVSLTAPGFEATLPGNLDYRGTAPFWSAGTIQVAEPGTIPITASVERPPPAGRLLGADSVAHLGALAATAARPHRIDARCRGYVDWYEQR
ncbi:MAG: hypothetical protein K0R88_2494 [Solirubrobacterales bacterium]|nr:hypothetical protein [Solirubrobacterales bacterium]